jgi:nicotinamidase-related amidase
MRVWDKYLTERDKEVHGLSGFSARTGFGKRPAVLVIDVNYAFTGDVNESIEASVKKWRTSCGQYGWEAIPHIQSLLRSARGSRIPVFFSTGIDARPDLFDRGAWSHKTRRSKEDLTVKVPGIRGNDIVREIAPLPHEIVIEKLKPSPFFGTGLAGFLIDLGVDTLLICGTTTSGCVRAGVIDAFSYNYRVAIVEECTFDRFESSHALNLFDMNAKYGDVIGVDEATDYLAGVQRGLYDEKIAFPAEVPA